MCRDITTKLYFGHINCIEISLILSSSKIYIISHLYNIHQGLLVLQAEPGTRVLVISGKPIGEPIVHYGPFVMNTMAEIKQAVTDYNSEKLV